MHPLPGQPRAQVFELGQFDLEFAGLAAGVLGEDVQNQLAAVDHLACQVAFQVALLGGRQIVVEDDHPCVEFLPAAFDLGDLARADERGRPRAGAQRLQGVAGHRQARGRAEAAEFLQRFVHGQPRRVGPGLAGRPIDTDQERAFGTHLGWARGAAAGGHEHVPSSAPRPRLSGTRSPRWRIPAGSPSAWPGSAPP